MKKAKKILKKMYTIEVDDTINRFIGAYYLFGFWTKDRNTFFKSWLKIFHFTYFVLFVVSIIMGAWIADEKDNSIYLTVLSVAFFVHAFRMSCTILKQKEILNLIDQVGKQSTTDYKEFGQINNKLKMIMHLVESFVWLCISTIVLVTAIPLFSNEKLAFNIWFPLDWRNSRAAFWVAHVYIEIGCITAFISYLVTLIIWYLMINFAIKYKILGNQLRNISGTTETSKKKSEGQKLFVQQLIVAIKSHQDINKLIDQFASYFGNLFLLQISTSSIGLCGSIYTMLFNSDGNFLQSGIYCVLLIYYILDIFIVMYLGHEIQRYRDRLSYCLYECNWIEQTQLSKNYVVIMAEVLKQPKLLIIARLYPLNLKTFTVIVKGAYSCFNILKELR